jgi:RND family efflux transporter MFP subunit
MNITTPIHRSGDESTRPAHLNRLLAQTRALQLRLAQAGRILESANAAAKAQLVRAAMETKVSRAAAAAVVAFSVFPTLALAQSATVRTASVTEEVVQNHHRVTGSLQAVSRASVATQEAGLIEAVLVDEGDSIAAGQIIARLDARRLSAQLEEARAERANILALVAQREAELEFARFDRDRVASAHQQGAATAREVSETETSLGVRTAQLDAARKQVDSIERRVELLEIRLEDMTVRAPFDSRVVLRHIEPGEWIEPGQPLVTLISTGLIEARLEVPERFAESLLHGGENQLYVELSTDGRSLPSIRVRPVPDIDPRARTFQVFVTLSNDAGDLAPGMSVSAWVPTSDKRLALLAPKDAVVRDGKNAYVYRVTEGETATAQQSPVTVLFSSGNQLAIDAGSGLAPGDRVIVEGNERLMPGAPVTLASLRPVSSN